MNSELISGDVPLRGFEHLQYFVKVVGEIINSLINRSKVIFFVHKKLGSPLIDEPTSPFRILQENFLREILALTIPTPAKILEVGCGRGQNHMIFQKMNIEGSYIGIDLGKREKGAINDRVMEKWQEIIDKTKGQDLKCTFKQISIYEFISANEKFNCVFSCSVLEHIDDISKAVSSMNSILSDEGISAHTVPAPFSYFLYGPHGYRRFSSKELKRLFYHEDKNCKVYALGGAFSYFTHFIFITLPLMVLKKELRRIIPTLYNKILYLSLQLDRFAPFLHTGYGITVTPKSHN